MRSPLANPQRRPGVFLQRVAPSDHPGGRSVRPGHRTRAASGSHRWPRRPDSLTTRRTAPLHGRCSGGASYAARRCRAGVRGGGRTRLGPSALRPRRERARPSERMPNCSRRELARRRHDCTLLRAQGSSHSAVARSTIDLAFGCPTGCAAVTRRLRESGGLRCSIQGCSSAGVSMVIEFSPTAATNSPLVAIVSPRWWPRISPPTEMPVPGVM